MGRQFWFLFHVDTFSSLKPCHNNRLSTTKTIMASLAGLKKCRCLRWRWSVFLSSLSTKCKVRDRIADFFVCNHFAYINVHWRDIRSVCLIHILNVAEICSWIGTILKAFGVHRVKEESELPPHICNCVCLLLLPRLFINYSVSFAWLTNDVCTVKVLRSSSSTV